MAYIFGLSNGSAAGISGIAKSFSCDYTFEADTKELLGADNGKLKVVEVREGKRVKKITFNVVVNVESLLASSSIISLLGTEVSASVSSLDSATEGLTGILTKATPAGTQDDWWTVSLTVEKTITEEEGT